jgi:serine/threonine-protein kinase HipA
MSLPPDYALNPMPTDVKARILSTNINLDEGTCSIALVESAAEYFGLTLTAARNVIREVGAAVSNWRDVAVAVGARPSEIGRMASAFEHDDLARARAL